MVEVFKNATEFMDKDVVEVYETDSSYYVKLKSEEYYDDSMWKIDKSTGMVEYVDYTWFLVYVKPVQSEHTKEIDSSEFKRAFS